ncbi:phosphoadenylyl-sulfate reductase [Rhodocaloribacter litoris]|uniref:phosphoadenylyl-sulfate reductase n=1 Tax=Rhodocaloribacter litoris TaxID=2558931 RepID=UPI00141F61D6|nr:phosphoadenylyl-sulfate reductase [Rhodocaloribacter litoris]QXD16241.1 phosphoadenylyl-sulfate reductase [Rhodocaloribacter litoris]
MNDPKQPPFPPETLRALSDDFARRSPRELLRWGFDTFGDDMVLGTGFGPSGIVLTHLVATLKPDATIFYLDTDLLFPETYALRDRLEERLGVTFTRVTTELSLDEQARRHGPELWRRDPDRCCFLRKVLPLRRFLEGRRAWVTGLRRDQSTARAGVPLLAWEPAYGVVKLNPLAHWTSEDVWSYLQLHDLPYNPLHDRGYPSLGCLPCTAPVPEGADERAGRWAGFDKTECGIHVPSHQAA